MRIGIDMMGSDNGSKVFIEALSEAVKKYPNVEFVAFGKEEELSSLKGLSHVKTVFTTQVIDMNDGILSIRRKKDSSMVKLFEALKNNEVDAAISAGSTAAIVTSAMIQVPLIEGILRPCLVSAMPTKTNKPIYMLDMGANSECEPEHLRQFAIMGNEYAKVFGVKTPKVALLNIGAEAHKGDKLHQATYQLLSKEEHIDFFGNIEGRDMFNGEVDVVVTDGNSGNMTLKAIEGTAYFALDMIKNMFMKNLLHKIAALIVKEGLREIKHTMDYSSYGGAYLMGFTHPIIKAHGSSNTKAVLSAITQTVKIVDSNVTDSLRKELV